MSEQGFAEFTPLLDAVESNERRYVPIPGLRWPQGANIAVNITVDFDAMLLRRLLNEPPMQLAKGEFGGRVGVWRLLELFESHGIRITMFTPGRICELYPDAVAAFAKAGHEIADHMWEHRVPAQADVERAHLARTCEAIERLTGRRPQGSRSRHNHELLQEFGFIYTSHHWADDKPYFMTNKRGRLVNLPFHYSIDDAMYFSFSWQNTENAAQRITDSEKVHDLWRDAFLQQHATGAGYLNICLHPFVSGRSMRIDMMDRLLTFMKSRPGVWFASCEDVARHCIDFASSHAKGA